MDKETRNRIQRATQAARRLLEQECAAQLEGTFDILPDGTIKPEPGAHLDDADRITRTKIVAAIEHRRAGGMPKAASVGDYVREAAFTILNRFVALKMLEARGLILESVSRGEQSSGFSELGRLAPGLADLPDHGYRLYLECLFDELGREIGVLFDRRDAASLLWPRRQPLADLLAILNDPDLAGVWQEDETIGWVYQYFNTDRDRERARYDEKGRPKAPQNSHELAVRNQFFTPRYVVQFLTDNTLGRMWYEMRQGRTRLADSLEYLVRRPNEVFLAEGEEPPADDTPDDEELSQEERLKKPHYVRFRTRKDPRDLRILDPACGSGHFLLYAFDLLLTTYEEAWADEGSPRSELTSRTLREDYPDLHDLRKALPGLILRQNLHGIEIDPRCAQIAALALWMRAQRAFNDFGIPRTERPLIAKTNIVIAEAMPGEQDLLEEFLRELREDRLEDLIREALAIPPEKTVRATSAMAESLADLVRAVWNGMELAGELGSLLKIELRLQHAIAEGRKEWEERLPLFRVVEYGLGGETKQRYVRFLEGRDQDFWSRAEQLALHALRRYAAKQSANGRANARRLFADDAERGFALIDLCRKHYDIALMNPPFGEITDRVRPYLEQGYGESWKDLFRAFIHRCTWLCPNGLLGSVGPRTSLFLPHAEAWREQFLLGDWCIHSLADLGIGVLDDAKVEVAAYVIGQHRRDAMFFRALKTFNKSDALQELVSLEGVDLENRLVFCRDVDAFQSLPGNACAYWVSERIQNLFERLPRTEGTLGEARVGLQTSDDFRFIRLRWEFGMTGSDVWMPLAKGGEYSPFYCDVHLATNWAFSGREVSVINAERYGSASRNVRSLDKYFEPGITWSPRTTTEFSPRILPSGCIFGQNGPTLLVRSHIDGLWVLAVLNSRVYQYLLTIGAGAADVDPGSISKSYGVGLVQSLPVPSVVSQEAAARAARCWQIRRNLSACLDVTSPYFVGLPQPYESQEPHGWLHSMVDRVIESEMQVLIEWNSLNESVLQAYGLTAAEAEEVEAEVGSIVASSLFEDPAFQNGVSGAENGDETALDVSVGPRTWGFVQRMCRTNKIPLEAAAHRVRAELADRADILRSFASEAVEYYVGIAFSVWDTGRAERSPINVIKGNPTYDPFDPIPRSSFSVEPKGVWLLTDDEGHRSDLVSRFIIAAESDWSSRTDRFVGFLSQAILGENEVRAYFRTLYFDEHLRRWSRSRRKAPLFWQLATPSAEYSLWLYYHRLTEDAFYSVLSDYVGPKLQHEERRLGALLAEGGNSPNAGQRRQIAEQEGFVEELRAFREEIARIAPLWNPNHDDGVIINFAPLWRLVPQHRAWQRECKACWDKLVAGDYDWSHLAMHLWPERVVPKCVSDRSLAIAHGLEDRLWVEDLGGRWRPRQSIDGTIQYLEQQLLSRPLTQTVRELEAFSKEHSARHASPGKTWWKALSGGDHDNHPLALALWPERVLSKARAMPELAAAYGIDGSHRRGSSRQHEPRHAQAELAILASFCDHLGSMSEWSERWAALHAGELDEEPIARFLYPRRVVERAQRDQEFATKHDLVRWFWLDEPGGSRRLMEPEQEQAAAVKEWESPAVKAALKSLLEAPVANGGIRRGRRRAAR